MTAHFYRPDGPQLSQFLHDKRTSWIPGVQFGKFSRRPELFWTCLTRLSKKHIYGLECASEFAVNTIKGCLERGIKTVEIKESEQKKFVAWFEENIKGFLWVGLEKLGRACLRPCTLTECHPKQDAPIHGCGSYYKNSRGHSNFIYPASGTHYWLKTRKTDFNVMDVTYGREKKSYFSMTDALKYAAVAVGVLAVVNRYRSRLVRS